MADDDVEEEDASVVPQNMKGLRSCLRCGLIKEYIQFENNGCENCEHVLEMRDSSSRIYQVLDFLKRCLQILS